MKIKLIIIVIIVYMQLNAYTISANKSIVINDTMFLCGNVKIKADNYYLLADSGILLSKESIIYIPLKSEISSGDSINLECFKLYYYINEKKFTMKNQQTNKNNEIIISSNSAIVNTDRDYAEYFSDCSINLKKENLNIKSDYLFFNGQKKTILLSDSINAYNKKGDYNILSDAMNIIIDSMYSFYNNVKLNSKNYKIESDSIFFYTNTDRGYGYSNTIVSNNSKLEAYKFKFTFENDTIKIIYAIDNVLFSNNDSIGSSSIKCDSAIINFNSNSISEIYFFKTKNASINFNKE